MVHLSKIVILCGTVLFLFGSNNRISYGQLHQPLEQQTFQGRSGMPRSGYLSQSRGYRANRSPNTLINRSPDFIQPVSRGGQPPLIPPSNSVPPVSNGLPDSGGHTFHQGSVYDSPYDPSGAESFPAQDQHYGSPENCLDCVNGYYQNDSTTWDWRLLPKDILYKSYLGGPREPRFGASILYLEGTGAIWALEAGGRAGILRYGSGPGEKPEGWQLDVWGAAHPRLNFNEGLELDAVDFKVGVPITYSKGPIQLKFEWNHISSHLGDEFMLRNPAFVRIDYLRDAFVLGGGYFVNPDLRLYAEAEYAYNTNGGSQPWHYQFGVDYSPMCRNTLRTPKPFFAINGHLREEVNYSGGVNLVTGLQWRGFESDSIFRLGFQFYQGQSLQYEFLGDFERLYGVGIWYDY